MMFNEGLSNLLGFKKKYMAVKCKDIMKKYLADPFFRVGITN